MTATYNYLGYGVTDSNGKAKLEYDSEGDPLTHSYTGTGAGKVDIVASLDSTIGDSSLVSETYEVIDALFYDSGVTGTPNTEWWRSCSSTSTITGDNTGLTFANTISGYCYLAPNKLGTSKSSVSDLVEWDDFVCEFTYHSATVTGTIQLRDSNGQVAQASLNPNNLVDGDIIRVEYTNNIAKFYKNNSPLTTDATNCSGDVMIRISISQGSICFSNYKVYSI